MSRTTHHPGRRCPRCGGSASGQTALRAHTEARPGDVVLCFHCLGVLVIEEGGALRVPGALEERLLEAAPELRRARALLTAFLRRN